jgi:aspartate-semialdehyde dehydrogenase
VSDRPELSFAGSPFGASPSFLDLVQRERPEAMPRSLTEASALPVPHGTTVLGLKFVVVGHNTIRGAAGASVLNAELLVAERCI